jgi:hypothetical protein
MFVSLEDFFDNYRIKNQQQPNETVLNRGLMRLKRETRELKSLIDILVGNQVTAWSSSKIYEIDEYVSYNDLVYKSRVDRNFNNEPFSADTTNWQLFTINSGGATGGTVIKYKTFTATANQTNFVVPFNIDSTPMVFVDGALLESTRYTVISNVEVALTLPSAAGDSVTIISGVTYDSSLVISKQRFVATAGQYLFTTQFALKAPSVFINGQLIDETLYTWSANSIDLTNPCTSGQIVYIANGSVLGSEIYTTADIDTLLSTKANSSSVYTKTDVDNLLTPKASKTYVDTAMAAVDSAKANKATTLAGYSISDAYTKTQVNTALATKVDSVLYTDEVVLQKLKNVDGVGSGLDSEFLSGLRSAQLLRSDIRDSKLYDFGAASAWDYGVLPIVKKHEIYLDVESNDGPQILLRNYNTQGVVTAEHAAYHTGNTSHMTIMREGYFKGSWEPTLDVTFGITNYAQYNWMVVVTPTLTGYEHDYNKDAAAGHTPYAGFDNNLTWDENQSEYHYGYIQTNTVKMLSIHRNGSTTIDIPARYQLIGILKTFGSYDWVNKP